LNNKLLDQNYFGPYDLEKNYDKFKNVALFCATELTSKEDILFLNAFVEGLI
jgi:glycine dehydrogenase subunit 1